MKNIFEKIQMFMYGRYGYDRLNLALFIAYLLINGIGTMIFRFSAKRYIVVLIAWIFLGFAIFRFLSKDTYKRQQEAMKFEQFLVSFRFEDRIDSLKKKFKKLKLKFQFRKTHRFRTCPNCGENLRISKRKGRREITCPKCGHRFKTRVWF